jgi:hypothetical protein
MAGKALSVVLPEPLWAAVHGEALRRCEAPATIVRDVLAGVVAEALRRDLAPVVRARSRIVDAVSCPASTNEKEKGSERQLRALPSGVIRGPDTRMLPAAGATDPVGGDGGP